MKLDINFGQVEFCFKMAAILDTILNIWSFWTKPISILTVWSIMPLNSHKKS